MMVTAATLPADTFDGVVEVSMTRAGVNPSHFVFTRKGNQLRIENTTNKLEPINVVDLNANRLTIIYPHNTTFVSVDLAKQQQQPNGARLTPMPGGAGAGMPMPAMPPMGMPGAAGLPGLTELKKETQIKKVQGYDCTLYTAAARGEKMEIWATNDSTLFPFRLITHDYIGRQFGPQMLEEQWPEMVKNKSLFPMEVSMKIDPGGQERFSFKVDKVEKSGGGKIDDNLFQPPKNYIKIESPQG